MKETLTEATFCKRMIQDRPRNQFTDAGLKTLFRMLQANEECTGVELDFNAYNFCMEYTEYENIEEYNEYYGTNHKHREDATDDTLVYMNDDTLTGFVAQDW